jgi:hypothetical protein
MQLNTAETNEATNNNFSRQCQTLQKSSFPFVWNYMGGTIWVDGKLVSVEPKSFRVSLSQFS